MLQRSLDPALGIGFSILLIWGMGACDSGDSGDGAMEPPGENTLPDASVTAPQEGARFVQGETITFTGSATDAEDGMLAGTALVWTSDRSGELGTGATVERSDLAVGDHVIALTATDSEGAAGSDTVEITVESPLPAPPPGITFASDRSGDFDIYLMEGGAGPTRLTTRSDHEFPNDWSSDGTKLLLRRGGVNTAVLWSLDLSSGGEIRLTLLSDSDPDEATTRGRWSPDASRVAYIGNGFAGLRAVDDDGSNLTTLADTYFQFPDEPDWSPDGTRVLHLVVTQTGENEFGGQVAIAAADGSGDIFVRSVGAYSGCPQYSPDGAAIAFVADSSALCAGPVIRLIDADGSGERDLVTGSAVRRPRWSPDGTMVAYVEETTEGADLFVVPAAGGAPTRLTEGYEIAAKADSYPVWSPGGDWIAFSALGPDRTDYEVFAVQVSDATVVNISDNPARDDFPLWRP